MLPMFMAVADQTIVATALPAIASGLGEIERASWVVVSYLIANTIAAPVYGRLGDTFGRRSIMIAALAIFMIGSVLCAISPNIELLTAARVLQGFGGGGLMTLSQALIGETIPPRERGQYQGYLAGVAVTSSTFGPVAGGYLTQAFGWQSIFLVNIPLGLIAVRTGAAAGRTAGRSPPHDFRCAGAGTCSSCSSARSFWRSNNCNGWIRRQCRWLLGLLGIRYALARPSALAGARNTAPLIPPALFKDPSIWRSDALGGLPWRRARLAADVLADLSARRARRFAGRDRAYAAAADIRHRAWLADHRSIGDQDRTHRDISDFRIDRQRRRDWSFLAFWHVASERRRIAVGVRRYCLFMGTVMGVVQMTVQAVAGPRMLGTGAAMVQFSRSVGAAFGTAVVAAVLFSYLALVDRQTASLFGAIIDQGPEAIASLAPARQAIIQSEIADAFRAAFRRSRFHGHRRLAGLVHAAAPALADSASTALRRPAARGRLRLDQVQRYDQNSSDPARSRRRHKARTIPRPRTAGIDRARSRRGAGGRRADRRRLAAEQNLHKPDGPLHRHRRGDRQGLRHRGRNMRRSQRHRLRRLAIQDLRASQQRRPDVVRCLVCRRRSSFASPTANRCRIWSREPPMRCGWSFRAIPTRRSSWSATTA